MEQTRWNNVKDGLPEKDGIYICAFKDDILETFVTTCAFFNGEFLVSEWNAALTNRAVTHWMHWPQLPEEVRKNGNVKN